jgi:hypothetical protein
MLISVLLERKCFVRIFKGKGGRHDIRYLVDLQDGIGDGVARAVLQ